MLYLSIVSSCRILYIHFVLILTLADLQLNVRRILISFPAVLLEVQKLDRVSLHYSVLYLFQWFLWLEAFFGMYSIVGGDRKSVGCE